MALIPGGPSLTVGGRVFTDLTNLIVIFGQVATNFNATPRQDNASTGYTPSGIKRLHVLAFDYNIASASAGQLDLGYADTDVGMNSAAAGTNAKGRGLASIGTFFYLRSAAIQLKTGFACDFYIPNGKFGAIYADSATLTQVTLYGYEVV